jgi:hypothetical protein
VGFMDRMKQAQDAMKTAGSPEVQQMQQQAMAGGGMDLQQGLSDRGAIEAQTHEFQRIAAVGQPAMALIKSITQTDEPLIAGLPTWEIDLEVQIEGQEPYGVKHREFMAEQSVRGYPVGGNWECKVDPADPQKVCLWQL